jgi:hypothetical protein
MLDHIDRYQQVILLVSWVLHSITISQCDIVPMTFTENFMPTVHQKSLGLVVVFDRLIPGKTTRKTIGLFVQNHPQNPWTLCHGVPC